MDSHAESRTSPGSPGASRPSEPRESALGGLLDEAQAAVSTSANSLRDVRERYRTAYNGQVERWEKLRTKLTRAEKNNGNVTEAVRRDEALAGRDVGIQRATLARIELAIKSLEGAWLFLAHEDASLVTDPSEPASAADVQMRVIEAQEAERSRLAREVHDGPAQALANGIFQVEVVERLLDRDEALARAELKLLREILNRELRSVRAYLSQLRPPLLADLGLSGAIADAAEQVGNILGVPVAVDLEEGLDDLPEMVEIVILRVVQEALQNIRKHSGASSVVVASDIEGDDWLLTVRDDGRGFDVGAVATRGRRNFGLQFMQERAELIGARFEVQSRPEGGTLVQLAIPVGAEENRS